MEWVITLQLYSTGVNPQVTIYLAFIRSLRRVAAINGLPKCVCLMAWRPPRDVKRAELSLVNGYTQSFISYSLYGLAAPAVNRDVHVVIQRPCGYLHSWYLCVGNIRREEKEKDIERQLRDDIYVLVLRTSV